MGIVPFPGKWAGYDYPNILMLPSVQEDIDTLLAVHGGKERFFAQFQQRLGFLSAHLGKEYVIKHDWFEKLKNAPDYLSMRFHKMVLNNLRILYCYDNKNALLLVAFSEKSKKDYKDAISLASARYVAFRGGTEK